MKFLISVYNKSGLVEFLNDVKEKIDSIYATHGTYNFLKENGFDPIDTSEITGFQDLLGGRVKTLHPVIYAGLLYRDKNDGINPKFDAVISNLYPFASSIGDEDKMIENIDIGGVSLTRAAAKNYRNVLVITDPSEYSEASKRIKDNSIDINFRKALSMRAFARMAEYDANIYNAFSEYFGYDKEFLLVSGRNGEKLRYGENPGQKGYIYADESSSGIANAEKLNGKELSYNNILDANSAFETALEFDENTAVIIKHNSPCGVSSNPSIVEAFRNAWNADSESAYGSVVSINREITEDLATEMKPLFIEVLLAPEYDARALDILKKKKNLRILKLPWIPDKNMRVRSISGGYLVQSPMNAKPEKLRLVTKNAATGKMMDDLLFAWTVAAHARSNAIVLAHDKTTTGIGSGQSSRVESVKIAIDRAGEKSEGSVLASDAFFPFSDSVEIAAKHGISAIIQPGGSIRDMDVIEKCNEYGIPMYFTDKRVFLH